MSLLLNYPACLPAEPLEFGVPEADNARGILASSADVMILKKLRAVVAVFVLGIVFAQVDQDEEDIMLVENFR